MKKKRTRAIIVGTVALILYGLFVAWWLSPGPQHPGPEYPKKERAEIRDRLEYHGLLSQVSIIHDWPENPWFERDGKRCSFYGRNKKL